MKSLTTAGRTSNTTPSSKIAACCEAQRDSVPGRCTSPSDGESVICTSAISTSPQQSLRTQRQNDDHDHEGQNGRVILEVGLAELFGTPDDDGAERRARDRSHAA